MHNQLEEVCTIKDAQFTEKCSRSTVNKRIKAGIYIAYKIGRSVRITVASIKAYRIKKGGK